MEKSKTQSINQKKIIWTCIGLRIIFATIFFHPDIKSQHFHASLFVKNNLINIYDYLELSRNTLPYSDTFNYPPLTYYFLASWQKIITTASLQNWLWDWSEYAIQNKDIYTHLLLLKLPYLIFDLLLITVLLTQTKKTAEKNALIYLWGFNPISLYAIYMIGQFDILPALLTCLSYILMKKSKYFLSGLCLGLAAATKTYPLLLIPLFLVTYRSTKASAQLIIGAVIGWLGPNIYFLNSIGYQHSVLQSSLAVRLFAVGINIKNIHIPLYPIYYLAILAAAIRKKIDDVVFYCFLITFSLVVFTEFHAQWLVWSLPFSLLVCIKYPKIKLLLVAQYLIAMIVVFLIRDQFVLIGLFTPLNPYLATIPPLSSFIPSAEKIQIILRLILATISISTFIKYHLTPKNV